MRKQIGLRLKIWRQNGPEDKGHFETYVLGEIDTDLNFLEMLDVLNEKLVKEGKTPVEFDHDCREGICGSCGAVVNGQTHGPQKGTALCQLHMRNFRDGETVVIEPWRSRTFPVIKDLIVDRSAFDRIIAAGGFIAVRTGIVPEANTVTMARRDSEHAMDAAACIGCGACVAACPNASAMLFVAAKVSHLALMPQGQLEKKERVLNMVQQMDKEGFGNCSNEYECEAACPKEISVSHIARMNKEYLSAKLK